MILWKSLPLFCVVACLVSSVVSSVLKGKGARRLSLFLSAAVCAAFAWILVKVSASGERVTYMMGHYPHPWGNELSFGIPEALMSTAVACVMFVTLLGGERWLDLDLVPGKHHFYYVLSDLVLCALLVLINTNDIFTGYVFIEICTLASCGLLMIRQLGRTTLASVRYMIFSLLGSGLFLLGVIFLYTVTGHLLLPDLRSAISRLWVTGEYHTPLVAAIGLITVGLGIKSGLFPFHFWMKDTYGSATPASSGILSGLVSKGYILFLIKLIFDGFGTEVFYASGVQNVLYVFGIGGMVVGSIAAIRENDVSFMLADSSAAQIGYIYMGIGLSPELGIQAALFHVLMHMVTKPGLFLSAAVVRDASGGSRKFHDLQGAGYRAPVAGAAFTIGALSMIGLPLTMGFISKYLFALAAFRTVRKLVPTLLALALSTVLNTLYFARTVLRLYNKKENGTYPPRERSSFGEARFIVSAVILSAVNVAAGIAASPLISLLSRGSFT